MEFRQYRQTWVSGIIDLASWAEVPGTSRAIRERISGGNLPTGCNRFLNEGMNFRTSFALVSRFAICGISWC